MMDLSHGRAYSSTGTLLAFTPTPWPTWRSAKLPSTAEMLQDIASTACEGTFRHLPVKAIQLLASIYVVESNKQEMVGTEDLQSTMDIINGLASSASEKQQQETRNTLKALTWLHDTQQDMATAISDESDQLLLTMDVIESAHQRLMYGLHPDAGKLRSSVTYASTDGGIYMYMAPEHVSAALQSLVDQHNFVVARFFTHTLTADGVPLLFNLAAQLALRFLTIHPFADGNGRLCRLLVNFILRLAVPFPVSMTPPYLTREQYITAIHSARNIQQAITTLTHPCDLAAMIIEGAWFSIKDARCILGQLMFT